MSRPKIALPNELFIISDLHIGGEYPNGLDHNADPELSGRGFRINTHVKDLIDFISEVRDRALRIRGTTELVINGDLVDFLAEKAVGEHGWRAFIEDEDEAVATLERIVDRDCGFFDALAALIESGVSLTLLLGNHDIEMSLPAVRSYLRARLGVKRFGAVQFIYDGEAYVVGDTLIEHGNRYDGWNAVDYDSLRRYRSESSRRLPLSPEAEFDPPVGSQ
jgi:hypothetical protein